MPLFYKQIKISKMRMTWTFMNSPWMSGMDDLKNRRNLSTSGWDVIFSSSYMKRILVSSENNYLSWRVESWFSTQNHLAHNWLFIQCNNQHLNNLKMFVLLYKLIDAFFRGSYKNRKILFTCLIRFFLEVCKNVSF